MRQYAYSDFYIAPYGAIEIWVGILLRPIVGLLFFALSGSKHRYQRGAWRRGANKRRYRQRNSTKQRPTVLTT